MKRTIIAAFAFSALLAVNATAQTTSAPSPGNECNYPEKVTLSRASVALLDNLAFNPAFKDQISALKFEQAVNEYRKELAAACIPQAVKKDK